MGIDAIIGGFIILLLSGALVCVTGAVFELRHFAHVLQLSSYQFQGYFRSLRQNFIRECLLPLLLLLTAVLYAGSSRMGMPEDDALFFFGFVTVILAIMSIIHYRPKKAKKKFVVTPRVKRLFLTTGILILLWMAAFMILRTGFGPQGLSFYLTFRNGAGELLQFLLYHIFHLYVWVPVMICAPVLIPLANLINKPAEQSINNGFIRDAQRILQEQPKMRIIGVTGSFGKTSVKYYLTTLLSEQYNVLMTPESYNTPMGIVRTIREQMKPLHEIFVCEMGARHVHDIKEITDFVHPDDGILTAIGEQHLETFHSLENIIATKYELLDAVDEKRGLPPGGKVPPKGADEGTFPKVSTGEVSPPGLKFVNGDDANIRAHMKYPDAITYGLNEGNDFRAIDIAVTPAGTTFKVQLSPRIAERLREEQGYVMKAPHQSPAGTASTRGGSPDTSDGGIRQPDALSPGVEFHTTLVGAHNVQNIMGAIAVATLYGIPASKLKRAVHRIEGVPHRLELKRHGNVTILDDAYNANPTGAATALETLALFKEQVKILVTPGMVELGEKEEEYNEAFGSHAARVCDYIIFVGNAQRTAALVRGAKSAGFDEARLFVKETFDAASVLMYEIDAGKEKVILLENDLPDNY